VEKVAELFLSEDCFESLAVFKEHSLFCHPDANRVIKNLVFLLSELSEPGHARVAMLVNRLFLLAKMHLTNFLRTNAIFILVAFASLEK